MNTINIKDSFSVSANRKKLAAIPACSHQDHLKNLEHFLNKRLKTLKSSHRIKDFRIKTP